MTHTDLYTLGILYPIISEAIIITPDGEIETHPKQRAAALAQKTPMIVCHAKWTKSRLGFESDKPFDVMELFAFVRPARVCLPTPSGLATALGLAKPTSPEDEALIIGQATHHLLDEIDEMLAPTKQILQELAEMMGRGGWAWAGIILQRLGYVSPHNQASVAPPNPKAANLFHLLPDVDDMPSRGLPGIQPVMPDAARQKLAEILGPTAEIRESQSNYAAALSSAFTSPDEATSPTLVLAEAGTGTGKTLGYLAPASLWAHYNKGAVWVSTYTRSLQQQIAEELTRIYPSAHSEKVVIRKGRENYLCLLNFEEALSAMAGQPQIAPALGLMARWIIASADGDLTGANFPAWLVDLMGPRATTSLSDRRGECIHSACTHYHKCFVEKSVRGAKHADIVIANHALVMINASLGTHSQQSDEPTRPTMADPTAPRRLIFDEGHHVFDAADSAFSALASAMEAAELRRWVRGAEDGKRGRARGLRKRLEELIADQDDGLIALEDASEAARCLPAENWRKRLSDGAPIGQAEAFFFQLRREIYQRAPDTTSLFDIQISLSPCSAILIEKAHDFATALEAMKGPLKLLSKLIYKRLDEDGEELDQTMRARLEGAARGLERRANGPISAWIVMLRDLDSEGRDLFVDWAQLDRRDGADIDIGLHRHFLDPTEPFAQQVLRSADGVAITSATLADTTMIQPSPDGGLTEDNPPEQVIDWQSAKLLTGASHLSHPALISQHASPFDYPAATKIFVVNDVARDRPTATAGAMGALLKAANGGGLGLFTAIQRLREVHKILLPELAQVGLPLYGQHVDRMNLATLIQLFREDRNACLLGTDAVRDGVDVPGDALRLMVYDRVPWPRPDILFKARADFHGREAWTDRITRLKLRQAFGRLIRRDSDKGVFVILDSRLPTRLTNAFPQGVTIERVGLAEAVAKTRAFLQPSSD